MYKFTNIFYIKKISTKVLSFNILQMKNKWTLFIEYINRQKIGDTLYRQDILSSTDEQHPKGCTTVDNYRNWLVLSGFLEKTNKKGEYKLLKHIDENLLQKEIKKMAYNYEYKMNQERFEKLSEILIEENIEL